MAVAVVVLGVVAVATVGVMWYLARLTDRDRDRVAPVLPCDVCGVLTAATRAHTHHHEPGCGYGHPAIGSCRCDPWRCAACCPCDVEALVERRDG